MKTQCKCHGVSGSCEVRTCWEEMPDFREIGAILKEHFNGASEVTIRFNERKSRHQLTPKRNGYKRPSERDLVYGQDSPDFCEQNRRQGSLGTRGRKCNRMSRTIDGCELMCCGRGFETVSRFVEERCNCQFQWCCEVQCDTCTHLREEHFCR